MSVVEELIKYTIENYDQVFSASLFANTMTFAGESLFDRRDTLTASVVAKTMQADDTKEQEMIREMLSFVEMISEEELQDGQELLLEKEKRLHLSSQEGKKIVKVKIEKTAKE